jgi:hypothetical protein
LCAEFARERPRRYDNTRFDHDLGRRTVELGNEGQDIIQMSLRVSENHRIGTRIDKNRAAIAQELGHIGVQILR